MVIWKIVLTIHSFLKLLDILVLVPRSHNLVLRWSRKPLSARISRFKTIFSAYAQKLDQNQAPLRGDVESPSRGVLIFINGYSFLYLMGNTLNTTFVILLVITLILFTFYYIINSGETVEEFNGIVEVTGDIQSYEVSHDKINFYHPTKKNTKRYNDKLFDYLEHIQGQRDKTFHKGKVFLKER